MAWDFTVTVTEVGNADQTRQFQARAVRASDSAEAYGHHHDERQALEALLRNEEFKSWFNNKGQNA